VEYFSNLVGVLAPWEPDGTPRPDRDQKLWFRAVEVFKDFLALRAPFQSSRLTAVAIVPQAPPQQRTMVNVIILNDRGEKSAIGTAQQGSSVALSADGNTAKAPMFVESHSTKVDVGALYLEALRKANGDEGLTRAMDGGNAIDGTAEPPKH
jgi:hypothetical protein